MIVSRSQHARRRAARPHHHVVLRVILASQLCLALLTGLTVVLVYRHLDGNLRTEDLGGRVTVDPKKVAVSGPREPLNILVMGSDSRDGAGNDIDGQKGGGERSDTTILLHVSADRKEAYGVSIPRDTLVTRPDCKAKDGSDIPGADLQMFNSAFSAGGAACTISTVGAITGIHIDHWVVVDFRGFRDMVDAVGGVQVCIPRPVDDRRHGIVFDAGTQVLRGEQALDYVRERYVLSTNSDIGRMKRQQAFIASMINKVFSAGTLARPRPHLQLPRRRHRLAAPRPGAGQPREAGRSRPAAPLHRPGRHPLRHRAVRAVPARPEPARPGPRGRRAVEAHPSRPAAGLAVLLRLDHRGRASGRHRVELAQRQPQWQPQWQPQPQPEPQPEPQRVAQRLRPGPGEPRQRPLRLRTSATSAIHPGPPARTVLDPGGSMHRRTSVPLLAAALALLAASLATPALASSSGGGAAGADDPSRAAAEAALTRVESLLAPAGTAARRAVAAGPSSSTDVSLALTNLWQRRGALARADRARADAVLARPSSGRVRCASVCVHYTTSGADRASSTYVSRVLTVLDHVRSTYAEAGYRRPPADGRAGGSNRFDVYLRDLGPQGLYGYCQPESRTSAGTRTATSFCVLDNDFSRSQYPAHSSTDNLRVTAAHEYFHAVQFAYDYGEDTWLMEATATWAEDELYTRVDDNRQYLRTSPISSPGRSLDDGSDRDTWVYGDWIFFRYLSERYPARYGSMPRIIRDLWRELGTNRGEPDAYSIEGVDDVLAARPVTFANVFADFAFALRHPAGSFSEGAAYTRFVPTPVRLRPGSGSVVRSVVLRHLASSSTSVYASDVAAGQDVRLDVRVPSGTGSRVLLDVVLASGGHRLSRVPLDVTGAGSVVVPFSDGTVRSAEVVLVNAGLDYDCGQGTTWSCQGTPLDDGRGSVRATAVTPTAS